MLGELVVDGLEAFNRLFYEILSCEDSSLMQLFHNLLVFILDHLLLEKTELIH